MSAVASVAVHVCCRIRSALAMAGWLPLVAACAPHAVTTGLTSVPVADAGSAGTLPPPLVGHAIPCTQGRAMIFACHNADLLAFLPLGALGGVDTATRLSNVWGWTDSATGREFALVGRSDGTAFVEVTDPARPKYLGTLPIPAGTKASHWHDMKVYQHYAFMVSDQAVGSPSGMQVFDLAQLRKVTNPPATFQETAHYDRVANVHTIALDAETGYAYLAGSHGGGETCGGGLHMVDVRTPTAPRFAGCYVDTTVGGVVQEKGYVHETVCVRYRGPDRRYQGRELCLNAAENALGIVDVTDKRHPQALSLAKYPNAHYVHQGWFSADQRYVFVDDELDEVVDSVAAPRTRTIVLDLQDLAQPVVLTEFLGTTRASDHNLYVRGRYLYQANYEAGLRILDARDPRHLREVSYFDTYPAADQPGFEGAWGNYPFFKSGTVAVSSEREGLFLIRPWLAR